MKNIILTGFMGTGKSTVGLLVAKRLGWAFVDTDALIEKTSGKTIAQIFKEEGEKKFRQYEQTCIINVLQKDNQVIAVGGGAIFNPENKAFMDIRATIICLRASLETIMSRIKGDQDRPLLGDEVSIAKRLCEREDTYASIAWQVNTNDKNIEEIVREIEGEWRTQEST
jgi:shikimate kinase